MKHSWSAIRWKMMFIFAFFSVISMILVACFAAAVLNVVIRRETAYLIEERIKVIVDGRKELTGSLVDRVSGCQGPASDSPLFTKYLDAVRPESQGLVSVLPKGANDGVSSTWHDTGWFAGIVADRGSLEIRSFRSVERERCSVTILVRNPVNTSFLEQLSRAAGLQISSSKPVLLSPYRAEEGIRGEIEANFIPGSRRPVPVVVTARNWQTGQLEDWVTQAHARSANSGFEQIPGPRALGGLRDNQWIPTGAHHTDPGFCWSFVYYSDDDGASWKSSRSGEIYIWDGRTSSWSMTGEPSVVEVERGKLLMFMRSNWGRLYKSWSFDDGETWMAPTPTPLAASGAPAQLRKIPGTGDLLVVWTQQSPKEVREGLIRTRLSTAISRTNGAIWEFFQNIESSLEGTRVEPGPIGFSRPEGMVAGPTEPAPERNADYIIDLPENYCRCSYPSVFFYRDHVLIGHTNAHFDADGKYVMPGRLRIVPISWLYGGSKNMQPNDSLRKMFPLP